MSTRARFIPYPVISAGNMASSLTSKVTIVQNISMPSYSLSWTSSSINGAVSVQVSNDYATNGNAVINQGTWSTVTLQYNGSSVTSIPITTDNSTGFIDLALTGAYAIRLLYAPTSGTGSLTVVVNGKDT
jgi:hypothetical protein